MAGVRGLDDDSEGGSWGLAWGFGKGRREWKVDVRQKANLFFHAEMGVISARKARRTIRNFIVVMVLFVGFCWLVCRKRRSVCVGLFAGQW